ncbi:methionyl-tRNA formyltransferase [Candidatus Cyanaurora vandensis]|uniref:methionyl-tRNA formyltransferase n=1 Tax=Candidatus Cyanaurora vandensis TaxID=2714958 RepID=UPI00257D46FB|nr:methionyl-tRNA formyltransferase [Candidatus Cyanaurora vandensis]
MVKVVFFGTPDFAVPTLERLLVSTQVLAVVTQPDRPAGRGGKLTAPPIKQLALAQGLPVYQPERLRKAETVLLALENLDADFFVVVAYGQILSPRVLAMPRLGCINVHGSLLPHYRGAAPVQWAVFHGETTTGITTMLMDAGLDTGPMLLKTTLPIPTTATSADLLQELAPLGADLLITTLTTFASLTPIPQDPSQSSYAPLITPQHLVIPWDAPATVIHNRVRAFYPQVYTQHRAQRLKILQTQPVDQPSLSPWGTVTQLVKFQGFQVSTGAGQLLVTQVQPAGKKSQSAWDYSNGSRLQVGEQLGLL